MAAKTTPTTPSGHAHYHHLLGAAAWSLPLLLLALLVLAGVKAGVSTLGRLISVGAPVRLDADSTKKLLSESTMEVGSVYNLLAGVHSVLISILGRPLGSPGGADLKEVVLTAILIALLVVGSGVWSLVSLKTTEIEALLGARPEAVQRGATATRARRGPG
jgi:hypothetical protein